jgi:hypothetical protein
MSKSKEEITKLVNDFKNFDEAKSEFIKLYDRYRDTKDSLATTLELNKALDESKQEKVKALTTAKTRITTLENELNEASNKLVPTDSDLTNELSEIKETLKAEKQLSSNYKSLYEDEIAKREDVERRSTEIERDANNLRDRVSALESSLDESNKRNLAQKTQLDRLKNSMPNNDSHGEGDNETHYDNNGEAGGDSNNTKYIIKEKTPNPNFETFNGDNNSNINDWLYMLNDHFDACNITDDRKPKLVGQFLRDTARSFFRAIEGSKMDWTELNASFIRKFQSPHHQEELRVKLNNLKQTSSVAEYINRFNSIINQVLDMSDVDKIHKFVSNLSQSVQAHVRLKHPKRLDDAMQEAQDFENNQRAANSIPINMVTNKKGKYTQFSKNSNNKRNFFSKNNNNNNNAEKIGANNHSGKPNNYSNKSNYKNYNNFKFKKNYSNKNNHKTNNLSDKDHKSSMVVANVADYTESVVKLMYLKVIVNDCVFKALLDSGSSVSIMDKSCALRANLAISMSNKHLQIANGNRVRVDGVTEFLEVNTHNCISKIKFLVLENAPYEVLLGLDWFVLSGAIPDATNRTLRFPGFSVELDESEDSAFPSFNTYNVSSDIEKEIIADNCWNEFKHSITTDTILSSDELILFNEFAKKNSDLLITDYEDLGCCNVAKHKIITTESKPIFIPPYRKSQTEREELKKEVDRLLKAGIIRPSKSPWSAPVIMIPKPPGPDGKIEKRFCTDFRALNAVTPQDHHPLPRIDDILDRLNGCVYITIIDLKCGYWQVALCEKSIAKTAFSTPDGHYEWLRVPFGLKNAPADFSRIMYQILGDLPYVQIYLDDITIHSRSFNEHIKHLHVVCDRLREANLKINALKCK